MHPFFENLGVIGTLDLHASLINIHHNTSLKSILEDDSISSISRFHICFCLSKGIGVATPLWPSVGVKPNTWKSWRLRVFWGSRMFRAQQQGAKHLALGVLGVIGKFLKRRYRKCPRIGNSDICSPSYGQMKGRESNWQFASRPLKVRNRPLPDVRFECATWRWKNLNEGYNFGLDLVAIQLCSRELWWFKFPGVPSGQFQDSISGVPGICAIRM
jgi:hypothetical protein